MKTAKILILIIATALHARVTWAALEQNQLLIAAPLSLFFLVLAYLGADLKVKSFSFDADDRKLSVNEGADNAKK